jgi:hypothetical protein
MDDPCPIRDRGRCSHVSYTPAHAAPTAVPFSQQRRAGDLKMFVLRVAAVGELPNSDD